MADRQLALVTGASTGIGYELAKLCVEHGFDVVMAADEPAIESAAQSLMGQGAQIRAIRADLATTEGVEHLCRAAREDGRPIAALFANAGIGLGGAFLDQDFEKARRVVDTNITGTIQLIHTIGRQMRERNEGKILITGSIAGWPATVST